MPNTPCPSALAIVILGSAVTADDWEFHVVHARTRAFKADRALGVESSRDGRGFYTSAPIRVSPGSRYDLSASCKTERAPAGAVFARVFWYKGPDRGQRSDVRKYDDTIAIGGSVDWTPLRVDGGLIAPHDANLAAIRLETNQPTVAPADTAEVAIAGRQVYTRTWHALLARKRIPYKDHGLWLDPAEFTRYRLVILCNTGPGRAVTEAENDAIRAYFNTGGHLVAALGTPCALAGGKSLSRLDWLGAKTYAYGALFATSRVLTNASPLTKDLTIGAELGSYAGRTCGLRGPTTGISLVGTARDSRVLTNSYGNGRVVFLGSGPPADPKTDPAWYAIFERAVLQSGITPTEGDERPFFVYFKDVVFREVKQ